jgi:putative flippase GtrA
MPRRRTLGVVARSASAPSSVAPREPQMVVRFGIVGLAGYAFSIALFAALVGPLGWDHRLSAAAATSLALACTFVVNRAWTFAADDRAAGGQAWRFAVVSAVAVGVNVIAVHVLVDRLGLPKVHGEALAVGVQAPVSYVGNRAWTFARH